MALAIQQFIDSVAQSGLMTREEVEAFHQALAPEKRPGDAQSLARELVAAGKLTQYQCQCIREGKARSLAFGEYVVLDKLGQGGMGIVVKAQHRRMKRLVAIKVLRAAAVKSPDSVERFYREAEAAARLTHPNIVTAYDASEYSGVHYLAMEYVDGSDLAALVKQHGPLPIPQAIQCIVQAARGLEYAHRHGIIHRDVKPSNLLAGLEEKYGKSAWYEANRRAIDAARQMTKGGVAEAEAEGLYARAVELFNQKELFELKPLVDKLRADHAASRAVTDLARKPSIDDLAKAVADLGKRLTVRLDGKGDFKSIQEAINAAPPKSVIEIEDNGPYQEMLSIPASQGGITLRGKKGVWPILSTPAGKTGAETKALVNVLAPDVALERLILIHATASDPGKQGLLVDAPPCRVHSVLFCPVDGATVTFSNSKDGNNVSSGSVVENSIILAGKCLFSDMTVRNCLFTGTDVLVDRTDILQCTLNGVLFIRNAPARVNNSILTVIRSQ